MDPVEQNKKPGNGGLIMSIVAIIVIIGGIFVAFKNSGNKQSDTTSVPGDTSGTTTDTNVATTTGTQSATATYKDGTYTAEGDYVSPGGPEHITVTLTLKDDVVTDATVVPHATISYSVRYQGYFVSGYKQYVIGKDISSINLTKVSGSSLTPKGFDDAVAKIEAQAKA